MNLSTLSSLPIPYLVYYCFLHSFNIYWVLGKQWRIKLTSSQLHHYNFLTFALAPSLFCSHYSQSNIFKIQMCPKIKFLLQSKGPTQSGIYLPLWPSLLPLCSGPTSISSVLEMLPGSLQPRSSFLHMHCLEHAITIYLLTSHLLLYSFIKSQLSHLFLRETFLTRTPQHKNSLYICCT